MTSDTKLYLSGYPKSLDEWSERALAQTLGGLHEALANEHGAKGRRALQFNIAVIEAEADRRGGVLTPQQVEQLGKHGALQSSIKAKASQRSPNERANNERGASRAQQRVPMIEDGRQQSPDAPERAGKGRERD